MSWRILRPLGLSNLLHPIIHKPCGAILRATGKESV